MKKLLALLLALTVVLLLPATASANSAEPPGLIVIVQNAPEDMTVTFLAEEITRKNYIDRETRLWESYFRIFYDWDANLDTAFIEVTVNGETFTCPLPEGTEQDYNTLLTLDLDSRTLTLGDRPGRQELLVALRVALTLAIEGLVLYLFGFRSRRSWVVFLILNLITQGALNVLLMGSALYGSYWLLGYILIEPVIFLVEGLVYAIAMKERTTARRVLCALTANAASLVLGGYLLAYLPV